MFGFLEEKRNGCEYIEEEENQRRNVFYAGMTRLAFFLGR